jgi:dienelactone hydrolase
MPRHIIIWSILACWIFLSISACKKKDEMVSLQPVPLPTSSITMVLKAVTTSFENVVNGYYVGLPSNYDSVNTRYPVLVYIPGAGQFGNSNVDLPLLLKDGPVELIDEKRFPSVIKSNGQSFTMIIFTPQLRWYPSTYTIRACIDFVKQNYRVDTSRIYLSGLSMGGTLSCDVGSEIPKTIAAIIPMAGVSKDFESNNKCQLIAQANLPVWAFQNADDLVSDPELAKGFIAKINSFLPVIQAKLTLWSKGGHDAWTKALDPDYKENGLNIYEWMLQYHR